MSQPIKTHYEKKNFIDQLASMTPSEINEYIARNGKQKLISPFVRVEYEDKKDASIQGGKHDDK